MILSLYSILLILEDLFILFYHSNKLVSVRVVTLENDSLIKVNDLRLGRSDENEIWDSTWQSQTSCINKSSFIYIKGS